MASSTLGSVVTGFAHYVASKGGIVGFTRALASDLAGRRHYRERDCAGARPLHAGHAGARAAAGLQDDGRRVQCGRANAGNQARRSWGTIWSVPCHFSQAKTLRLLPVRRSMSTAAECERSLMNSRLFRGGGGGGLALFAVAAQRYYLLSHEPQLPSPLVGHSRAAAVPDRSLACGITSSPSSRAWSISFLGAGSKKSNWLF